MKTLARILSLLGIVIAVLAFIIFTPTFNLSTSKMIEKESTHFVVHYEPQDETAANKLTTALEDVASKLHNTTSIDIKEKTGIYIYPNANTLYLKKYGLFGKLISSNDSVGDHVFTDVVMVSPNSTNPNYSYDDIIAIAKHEYIHAFVCRINSTAPTFLNEGLAGYLSSTSKPTHKFTSLPPIEYTHIAHPRDFKDKNIAPYAYTYIEYLDKVYGMGKVTNLLSHPRDYKSILGKTEEQVYTSWCEFLKQNY